MTDTNEIQNLTTRVAALEIAVAALQAAPVAPSGTSEKTGTQYAAFSEDKLSADWADKKVRKDPKWWNGESYVGQLYSECPVAYLEKLANQFEFEARKGQEKSEPRLDKNGKPWFEKDIFEARLVRTWIARRRREAASVAPVATPADALPGLPGLDADSVEFP